MFVILSLEKVGNCNIKCFLEISSGSLVPGLSHVFRAPLLPWLVVFRTADSLSLTFLSFCSFYVFSLSTSGILSVALLNLHSCR